MALLQWGRPNAKAHRSPEQVYGFVRRVHAFCHTHGEDNHLNEKEHEEHEKSVSEPFRRKPSWSHFLARPLQGVANLEEELTTAAVVVAVAFTTTKYCHQQRNEEADHAKPRKHDVEESEGKVCGRHNPEVIAPALFVGFAIVLIWEFCELLRLGSFFRRCHSQCKYLRQPPSSIPCRC